MTELSLHITVCTPRMVRLRFGAQDQAPASSYLPPHQWPETAESALPIDTGAIMLTRDLALCDRAGAPYLRLTPKEIRPGPPLGIRLEIVGEQHFYGLGQGGQQFDRLGITRRLWNTHVNHGFGADIAIPLLLSHRGYGLFFDGASKASLEMSDSDHRVWLDYRCEADSLDLYFFDGGSLRESLGEAATLLGHAPMPPRWALGYLQSTRHFESSDELQRLPRTFREKRLPCDGLIYLSSYGDAKGWNRGVGHLESEPGLLSDLEAFVAELHARHFHVITHEYPVVHDASPLFAEAKAQGYLLDSGYPRRPPTVQPNVNYHEGQRHLDFSQAEARVWWWSQHKALLNAGVDGWWLDGGEGPAEAVRLRDGPSIDLHNRYDLLRHQAFAEGEARDRPDRRVLLLCRSGGAGMQRFGAACWTGDIDNSMATLEMQPPLGLNVAMSGVPLWGTDIGGFYSVVPASGERFARWVQFGAFCPLFRCHGRTWRNHLPWSYGPEIEAICRQYLELRYRLMPYTYSLMWQAHRLGLPLMRPLVLNYPNDPQAWALGHEYLWGDDILVAPVTREGATHWPVYLPEGEWLDFWTHERYRGPHGITVEAPLERLPLFLRGGAIVPMSAPAEYATRELPQALTLLVCPGGHSSFTLYEDDGETNGYRRGESATCTYECEADNGRTIVRIGAPQGDQRLFVSSRTHELRIFSPAPPRSVELAGVGPLPSGEVWRHDGSFVIVRVERQPATIELIW
jgi:alpha-glucosidase (family GH31 glycosyl hydrolase)